VKCSLFASHEEVAYEIKDVPGVPEVLAETGKWAREHGHRITAHPGQFNQLASPRESVITNSIRTLSRECEVLDLMGMGSDSVMIIHMGGKYDGKDKALGRFVENWKKVPKNVQDRLVLENDELCYNVEDLLPICKQLKIPMVVDWHHDSIYQSTKPLVDYIPEINEIWKERGIPVKQHYSEGRPGAVTMTERRGHSSRVMSLPPCEDDVDLMIEAKDKEMAVFQLYQIYDLFPVDKSILTADTKIQVKKRVPKKKVVVDEVETDDETTPKKNTKKIHRKKVITGEEEGVKEQYGEDMAVLQDSQDASQSEKVLRDSTEIVEKKHKKRAAPKKREAKKARTIVPKDEKKEGSCSSASDSDSSSRPKRKSRSEISYKDESSEESEEEVQRKSLRSRRRKSSFQETDSSCTDNSEVSDYGHSDQEHHTGVFAVKHAEQTPKLAK